MKHTPGPWEYQEKSDAYTHIVRGPNDRFIVQCGQSTKGEEEANARLIAAAPDLLEELEHLVALLEPMERGGTLNVPGLATLNGARAAIAKAEGRHPTAD